jgi:hypothetical protein
MKVSFCQAQSGYDFQPDNSNIPAEMRRLPLKAGDIVNIYQQDDSGWWLGLYTLFTPSLDFVVHAPRKFIRFQNVSFLTMDLLGEKDGVLGWVPGSYMTVLP